MNRSRLATYAIGIAVATALTGCGGSDGGDGGDGGSSDFADEKPADIVAATQKAMGDLESLSISGETSADGETANLDLQLSSSGDCTGTISFDTTGTIEILGVGEDRWFKGDESFWSTTGIPDTSSVLDKWVIDAQDDFAQFCAIDDFVGEMFQDDTDETFTSKGIESLDGDDVIAIEQDDATEGISTGYVLVDEPHYMVKVEKEGDNGGTITFSGFDEEFEVTAPSADEIVDLDQLG
jgi:hypothetical protein